MVVELLRVPEVPVTVTVYGPWGIELLGVRVRVLLELVTAGLNVAVTPLGSPEIARLTSPLNPF
jgi:hypothetical protein